MECLVSPCTSIPLALQFILCLVKPPFLPSPSLHFFSFAQSFLSNFLYFSFLLYLRSSSLFVRFSTGRKMLFFLLGSEKTPLKKKKKTIQKKEKKKKTKDTASVDSLHAVVSGPYSPCLPFLRRY
eukprot:TRINITY_DN5628_c2_g1_i1.p1 TRINITY_DN5628_c2_g1~~TRINITY_DN5628_c2_g1_i1.p1  ORF type:complete len:125 (+),score=0.29 TRINITY_DN5628_c2_g1_i1:256-630(+)